MVKFNSKNGDISYKHDRIVRVISSFKDGTASTGTGFFVNGNRNVLTCWHVISGIDLKILKNTSEFQQSAQATESEKVNKYFRGKTSKIEVELPNGIKVGAILKSYDYYYDIAVLRLPKSVGKLPFFGLELKNTLDYFDEINFCGYPMCLGYSFLDSPFAVNSGIVSAFPEVDIAGGKYKNIQLSSICMGGNSGAPLFKKGDNRVYGIINGYYYHGRDDLAVYQEGNLTQGSIRVPINISYATGFDLLMSKSTAFENLVKKE